ncbi:hypothetical protein [Dyella choica]|uniref:DUF1579 domain-containing protein n=1 Tax=Dyella choica TaxID=1927959 RepID=A0A3S0RNA7_9GAMM|nr:hypothetical protein [Dyella choica]RUL79840.1 hypothetical protein EKH80_01180 [Dyella choica]
MLPKLASIGVLLLAWAMADSRPMSSMSSSMIEALRAEGPHASLGAQASVFGRLVGTWDLTCERHASDGAHTNSRGIWSFGWVIDGRILQDVIDFFAAGQSAERDGGTTLRFYDTQTRQWRVYFFAPARNAVIALAGGAEGNRIVLRGNDVDGSLLRWSFNDIKPDSLYWKGEISHDGGKSWRIEQEMHLTRHR